VRWDRRDYSYINIAAPHILEFQFDDLIAFAYNSPGGGDISFQNLALDNLKTEKHAEAGGGWSCGDDITDSRDDKVYGTVQIGEQCWMQENLAYDQSSYGNDWCYGDDCATYEATYGRLYDWTAAMQGSSSSDTNPSGVQGVCPTDWHLPSDDEWEELEGEVDSTYDYGNVEWDGTGYRGDDVGQNLKEDASEGHWSNDNGVCNSSGFTAVPNGYIIGGTYSGLGNYMYTWTATETNEGFAYYRTLAFYGILCQRSYISKASGFSVRCLR